MITVNGNRTIAWRPGITVADVLQELGWDYVLITTTVNGQFVARDDYGSREVPDGAEVKAIHIAHGG
jgi:thiamine biosynthesis protein ThiS